MVKLIKRAVGPVLRLTAVQPAEHQGVFEAFAAHVGKALVDERVRHEPRVVSFRRRASR